MTKKFDELNDFIQNKMRMSHIYQPAMLSELLGKGGSASINEISKSLLSRDISQIDYYSTITKNHPGRVLRKHKIVGKNKDSYDLIGFEELSSDEVEILIQLCKDKESEYIERRGEKIWSHRKSSSGNIPGTLRYEVLKRAKYRCELCGISAEEKALEVDHILPRNNGGTDDLSNLQALCYSCNAMKRDRDDTDFRGLADSYKDRDRDCVFCNIKKRMFLIENELSYAILDINPIATNHTLIIPKRHVYDFFDLYQPEINAIYEILGERRKAIDKFDTDVTGFNIMVSSGDDAGQEVPHAHVHLVPTTVPRVVKLNDME